MSRRIHSGELSMGHRSTFACLTLDVDVEAASGIGAAVNH
jgi:hypothetical protein